MSEPQNNPLPNVTTQPQEVKISPQSANENSDPAKDFDVSHWEEQKINNNTTAEFSCVKLCNPKEKVIPVLYLKPAHATYNKDYEKMMADELKQRELINPVKTEAELLKRIREINHKLLPLCLISGWDNLFDRQKKPIPYKKRTAVYITDSWKEHFKDEIINFCSNLENFSKIPDILFTDEQELKNLPTGSTTP